MVRITIPTSLIGQVVDLLQSHTVTGNGPICVQAAVEAEPTNTVSNLLSSTPFRTVDDLLGT